MKKINIDTECIRQESYIPFTVDLGGRIYEGVIVRSTRCAGGLSTEEELEVEWMDDDPTDEQITDEEVIETYEKINRR